MLTFIMLHQEFEPSDILKDAIKCFWYNVRAADESQPDFEVLPDGYTEIIFHFGILSFKSSDGFEPLPSPFMIGLLNKPAVFQTESQLQIIGIRCFPWSVFDLLELPSSKGGIRIIKHPIAKLQPALEKQILEGRVDEAISLVKSYFVEARSRLSMDSMLFKAGLAMLKANGTIPVSEVASAAHATVRTLERKFKQSSGHSVKDISAVMRFEQVRNQLWLCPETSIAGLAEELGYTDQSHLSKEFKRYSGTTPGAFARKARQQKQIVKNDFVAFVQD
ncbi:helix-turn-helix domain-containing protein [Chryseolinea sp. T2]|uniref:helix-turn-helix domain-containing protein n=1 Tax=Chryseolinea sp. T2 TaxID=3129255 RepID=UPI003078352B